MKYTLYTRGNCQACTDAKRYLRENEVEYTEIYLMTESDIKNIKSQLPAPIRGGQVALPLVFDEFGDYIGDKIAMVQDHQDKLKGILGSKELHRILKNNVCHIVFTKVDGSERKMRCTLMGGHLPPGTTITESKDRAPVPNFMAVYDLDKDAWRGFRVDSLKSIEVIGE